MKQHALAQGSPDWHQHRLTHLNASDAPAMLGCSPYQTRSELLHAMHTGLRPEVDPQTQRRFDRGHAIEEAKRPVAEVIIGEDLYPVVGSEGELSASFDGLTMARDVNWECKSLNDALRGLLPHTGPEGNDPARLPLMYRVQMEQQCAVSGCTRVLFTASDGQDDDRHCWYYPDPALRAEIIAGWAQFALDLANYKPAAHAEPEAVGRAPESLPALRIEVTGMVTASNLDAFREHALAVFGSINRTLTTDQDFATAKSTVKWCGDVETRLAAAKQHALSQTESIDALFRTIDDISAESKKVRLELDKLVTRREAEIKGEIVSQARAAYEQHIAQLTKETGPWIVLTPPDFAGAIKGKRSLALMQDALDTAVAAGKIAADASARKIRANLACIQDDGAGFEFLFNDRLALISKPLDDLQLLVRTRIADHKAAEEKRLEADRERIRIEEQAKAEKAARETLAAEQRDQEAEAARERERQATEQNAAATAAMSNIADARKADALPGPLLDQLENVASGLIADLTIGRAAANPPTVVPIVARAAPAAPPTLRLGQIGERLGFSLTADFLKQLGFEPAARDKTALLFHEGHFPLICEALVAHVRTVAAKQLAA